MHWCALSTDKFTTDIHISGSTATGVSHVFIPFVMLMPLFPMLLSFMRVFSMLHNCWLREKRNTPIPSSCAPLRRSRNSWRTFGRATKLTTILQCGASHGFARQRVVVCGRLFCSPVSPRQPNRFTGARPLGSEKSRQSYENHSSAVAVSRRSAMMQP